MQFIDLPIAQIQVPETRITSYMEEDLAGELESSLQTAGILEPLLVVHENGQYILVNGLHRLQVAQAHGNPTVPCVVKAGTYHDAVLQNLATSWLHGHPKQSEIRKVIKLLEEEFGLDAIGIRKKLGISQTTIENLMWVNQAIPQVQAALDAADIPLGAAVAMARVPSQETQKRLLIVYLTHHPNVDVFAEVCTGVRQNLETTSEELLEAQPQPSPTTTTTIVCDACECPTPPRHLRPLMLCPGCYGSVWTAISLPASASGN